MPIIFGITYKAIKIPPINTMITLIWPVIPEIQEKTEGIVEVGIESSIFLLPVNKQINKSKKNYSGHHKRHQAINGLRRHQGDPVVKRYINHFLICLNNPKIPFIKK